jgi:hypothetical protein
MTSKNKPNVTIVMGKVNKMRMGFIKMLSNPRTTATISEVVKVSTETPGIKCAMTTTKRAVIKILKSKFMFIVFESYQK